MYGKCVCVPVGVGGTNMVHMRLIHCLELFRNEEGLSSTQLYYIRKMCLILKQGFIQLYHILGVNELPNVASTEFEVCCSVPPHCSCLPHSIELCAVCTN